MCNFNAKTIKIPGRSPTCLDGSPWPITVLWTWTRSFLSLEFPACGWVYIQAYLTAVATLLPSAHLRAVCSGPACCSLSSKCLLYYDKRGQEKQKEKNEEEEGGHGNNDILILWRQDPSEHSCMKKCMKLSLSDQKMGAWLSIHLNKPTGHMYLQLMKTTGRKHFLHKVYKIYQKKRCPDCVVILVRRPVQTTFLLSSWMK